MPFYDESFIHDDNQNQRRNKRSYHIYKNGGSPLSVLERNYMVQTLEDRGTTAIKRNIKNIKSRNRLKPESANGEPMACRSPDIITDHCVRTKNYKKYSDIRNNNLPLISCKSYDNLTYKHGVGTIKSKDKVVRNGHSLQNLVHPDEHKKLYVSPLIGVAGTRRSDSKNSYSVEEARRRPIPRRYSRCTPAPGIGVYRKITLDNTCYKNSSNDSEGSEPGSGHRGSLRGANKLARRARSFKDDLLERINNMRSPAQQHHTPLSTIRSHSPLSPKIRNMGTKPAPAEEGEVTPADQLKRLVKEVTFGLKHFSDVIKNRKLEMLPDNGTMVFESIANIHKAIKPYCGSTPTLTSAVKRLCSALAMLIRLCDEITAGHARDEPDGADAGAGAGSDALAPAHVSSVVGAVTAAVDEVATLARQHMTRPALSPRPALVSPRASTQRNSLPDIPLTPKEISQLTGEGGDNVVRAAHSSESILDAPDTPPPKPARPNVCCRKIELAPPLPPKRKSGNDNSLLALSIDRLSLQSHSSGSLDSMLNTSHEEERLAHDHVFATPPHQRVCSCGAAGAAAAGGEARVSLDALVGATNAHNHNRFSNESGFVSVGHADLSTEHIAFSSHHYSSHSDRLASITSEESEAPPELPAKTRRPPRADLLQNFPHVEIRKSPVCSLHGAGAGPEGREVRPHTVADNHPPPLPLKKKHIMAYMEMFGNCSHATNTAVAASDMFRHSIHTYNMASAQHTSVSAISVQRHPQVQRTIAQSLTVQHFGSQPLSGSEDSVNMIMSSESSPVPSEPPALPPKMNKNKQIQYNSNELIPPSSPRPCSHNSSADESVLNNVNSDDSYVSASTPGKFPVGDDYEMLVEPPTPSPVPSQRSESSIEATPATENNGTTDTTDIILQTDVSQWLHVKTNDKDESEIRGGNPDALIVLATKATKDFAYQEAFLATYRTWVSPSGLAARLARRARHARAQARAHDLRSTLSLLTRVVADLTLTDLEGPLMQEIMEFIYWLVETEELAISKALRQILVEKQKQIHFLQQNNTRYDPPCLVSWRDTLLDFKASELAEQMTILDAALFVRITTAEVLSWPRDQSEESSPNLTRFTAHFNKMSYWARSRILEQDTAEKREKYANRFLKVMKKLRKLNNFNSYLALVSALDSPPVRRLDWPRTVKDSLNEFCAIIEPSSSFRAYRLALAETQPPCIPYIGLILQDLTFVHIGNPDLLQDGTINFTKRWQQYNIMENMKRFHKDRQYKFKRHERIQGMFNEFEDVLSEEAMWQISESIKPRPSRAPAPQPAPAPPLAQTPA